MKISIAMATYNGAKYLHEQLESFATQTRLPDELVVADDGSTDDTLKILESFAKSAPFQVHIYRNDVNLGYAQNFGRALGLCAGDMIFLSDQDDIWFKDKIKKITQIADRYPECMVFMNDAELTLGDSKHTGLTMLGQTLSLGLSDSDFPNGCCMAIRSSIVELALPVPAPPFVHDIWLNRLCLLLDAKNVVPQVLQYYRRHGDNNSNWIASRTTKQSRLDLIRAYRDQDPRPHAVERLRQLGLLEERFMTSSAPVLKDPHIIGRVKEALKRIQDERNSVAARLRLLDLPRWQRCVPIARFYFSGGYGRFSGWKSFVKDILIK